MPETRRHIHTLQTLGMSITAHDRTARVGESAGFNVPGNKLLVISETDLSNQSPAMLQRYWQPEQPRENAAQNKTKKNKLALVKNQTKTTQNKPNTKQTWLTLWPLRTVCSLVQRIRLCDFVADCAQKLQPAVSSVWMSSYPPDVYPDVCPDVCIIC